MHRSCFVFARVLVAAFGFLSVTVIAAPVERRSRATLNSLFPAGKGVASWSTWSGASGSLPLSDDTLRPTKKAGLSYSYVTHESKNTMKAHFSKGSYRLLSNPPGGLSFYALGPSKVDISMAKEATFGYSIMFPDAYAFNKGGKLPGFYGGDDADVAASCSGGRRDIRCFSARLMWRKEGMGELYTYLPPYTEKGFEVNETPCKQPNSECNPTYGASIQRGSFSFKPGEWTVVAERVKLNDPKKANGEIELFVNGKSTIVVKGVKLVDDTGKGRFRGMQMQTFFGGSTSDWASPKDQDLYFADFSVAILSKF